MSTMTGPYGVSGQSPHALQRPQAAWQDEHGGQERFGKLWVILG